MKKYLCLIILLFSFFLSGSFYEEEVEKNLSSAEKSGFIEEIPGYASEILEKIGIDALNIEDLSDISFGDIAGMIIESLKRAVREPFEAVLAITVSAMVCSLVSGFCSESGQAENVISAVSVLSASAVFLVPVKNIISDSAEIINECSNFMLSFIPVYSSALAASGYISASAGFRTLMLGAVTAISEISSEIILPLILIYLAICISGAISSVDIGEISKAVKSFAVWVLGITMAVFSGIMGLGTLVSSSADNAFSKTAKFLIGSAVPVVGSTVSDAVSSVRSCLMITKNFLGVYAVLAIAAIFLPPIISLFLWKTCISVSSGIGGVFGNKNLSGLLSSVSAVLGIMLSLVITTGIMFVFSVTILLMTGGGT